MLGKWSAVISGRSPYDLLDARRKAILLKVGEFKLKISTVASSFNVLYSFIFLMASYTARKSALGAVVNVFYITNALLGVWSSLELNRLLVCMYIINDIALNLIVVVIAVVDYLRWGEPIAFYLYIPGVVLDLAIVSLSVPLSRALFAAHAALMTEGSGSSTAAPPTAVQLAHPTNADSSLAPVSYVEPADFTLPDTVAGLEYDIRCPISLEIMRDPVIAADGHTYERASIEQWLRTHANSPKTGERLPNKNLTPNYTVRSMVATLQAQSPNPSTSPAVAVV
ncbi:hypothetical protein CYMTET_55879 [Cymbomonas tetramitiformis]|uniref:U-box domain-containing protein n=1 Tax=Cymbomonas tetramitiformis TaxID=36881 RepID=A0AAE0BDI7_9CHLO|nr:hypothetical protein CYMTET_55879 [Cymbomonas tetramitiformis]